MSSHFQTRHATSEGSPFSRDDAPPDGFLSPSRRFSHRPTAALAFATALIRNPRGIGAVAPASRWLAGAMGRQLDGCACNTLVEIGPGTGAITRELHARRSAFSRVFAVERDEWMASVLRERYAGLEVVHGCASELNRHLSGTAPVVIVSSLPFKSLPGELAGACIQAIVEAMDSGPDSMLLQYTYGLGSPPFEAPEARFAWTRVGLVMRNLPPATIWRLEHSRR